MPPAPRKVVRSQPEHRLSQRALHIHSVSNSIPSASRAPLLQVRSPIAIWELTAQPSPAQPSPAFSSRHHSPFCKSSLPAVSLLSGPGVSRLPSSHLTFNDLQLGGNGLAHPPGMVLGRPSLLSPSWVCSSCGKALLKGQGDRVVLHCVWGLDSMH